MNEDLKFYLTLAIAFVVSIATIFWLACGLVAWECSRYAEMTNRATKASFGTCYIQHQGAWYTASEFRFLIATGGKQ